MSGKNCGYCYNRGCLECEPSLRAAARIEAAVARPVARPVGLIVLLLEARGDFAETHPLVPRIDAELARWGVKPSEVAAAENERADIVRWLKSNDLQEAASRIERGEHRSGR